MDLPTGSRRDRVVAWLTVALGGAGLLRLISEVIGMFAYMGRQSLPSDYKDMLEMDVLLGFWGLASGWSLIRKHRWGSISALSAWSATAASSGVMLWAILDAYSHRAGGRAFTFLIPRMTYCGFVLIAFPYVLWGAIPRCILWKPLLALILLGVAAGSAVIAGIILGVPHRRL
jgi:hypothetical protein